MACIFCNLAVVLPPGKFNEKGRINKHLVIMNKQVLGTYLRTHRKRSGLNQRELGLLLGYKDAGQISRHERSEATPPLITALAYEVIFGVPVATLFTGIHLNVSALIETNIMEFEKGLHTRNGKRSSAKLITQKLEWLNTRKRL